MTTIVSNMVNQGALIPILTGSRIYWKDVFRHTFTPTGGECKTECNKRKKKSGFAREAHSQVSFSGATTTGLSNSHPCGNMSFVSKRPCLQNNIAKGSLHFKLKYIEHLKPPAEKYLKQVILDKRVYGVRPEGPVL